MYLLLDNYSKLIKFIRRIHHFKEFLDFHKNIHIIHHIFIHKLLIIKRDQLFIIIFLIKILQIYSLYH